MERLFEFAAPLGPPLSLSVTPSLALSVFLSLHLCQLFHLKLPRFYALTCAVFTRALPLIHSLPLLCSFSSPFYKSLYIFLMSHRACNWRLEPFLFIWTPLTSTLPKFKAFVLSFLCKWLKLQFIEWHLSNWVGIHKPHQPDGLGMVQTTLRLCLFHYIVLTKGDQILTYLIAFYGCSNC